MGCEIQDVYELIVVWKSRLEEQTPVVLLVTASPGPYVHVTLIAKVKTDGSRPLQLLGLHRNSNDVTFKCYLKCAMAEFQVCRISSHPAIPSHQARIEP